MPFDWTEFLTLADELAARNDEAAQRTAISRAYYFVYHLALARAAANTITFTGQSKHQQCWNKYGEAANNQACQDLGREGERMKRLRHNADYDAVISRVEDKARRIIQEARRFSTELQALDAMYPRP